MPILAAVAFVTLVASLVFDVSSRLRPPPTQGLPLAWSELAAPGAPVRLDQAAHWTFVPSTFPSWLWKLGRFELRVPLPTNEVVKRLKERLRSEPAYALFLPIGGRAVGWVQDGYFQASLIGDFSRHPSSWIADGAIVPAGDGTILRSDLVVRKSRLVTFGLVAIWILLGSLYASLTSLDQPTNAAWRRGGPSLLAVFILIAYLGLLRGMSWFSGRRLQRFLVEAVLPSNRSEAAEPVGYASMIRNLEDEISPRETAGPPHAKVRRKR